MDKKIGTLYKICEALFKELGDYSKKVEKSDSMSTGDLEAIDKLSHAIKSIKTTIAMMESEEEDGYSGHYMPWYGRSYDSTGNGRSNRGGTSSARRGRSNNSSGRNQYSREGGYSYAEEEFELALKEAMSAAPDEHVREKLQRIMNET